MRKHAVGAVLIIFPLHRCAPHRWLRDDVDDLACSSWFVHRILEPRIELRLVGNDGRRRSACFCWHCRWRSRWCWFSSSLATSINSPITTLDYWGSLQLELFHLIGDGFPGDNLECLRLVHRFNVRATLEYKIALVVSGGCRYMYGLLRIVDQAGFLRAAIILTTARPSGAVLTIITALLAFLSALQRQRNANATLPFSSKPRVRPWRTSS